MNSAYRVSFLLKRLF